MRCLVHRGLATGHSRRALDDAASSQSNAQNEKNYRNWSRTVIRQDKRTGAITTEQKGYVELGSGLNYRDATGQWQETREEFVATPDGGFAAERGPHKLRLGRSLNALPSVQLNH